MVEEAVGVDTDASADPCRFNQDPHEAGGPQRRRRRTAVLLAELRALGPEPT
jgi:hypothetical protein